MIVLYICSSESYAGKSVACLVFGRRFQEMGLKVGYFKPLGTLPTRVAGVTTDDDAVFIAQSLGLTEPPDALCPVLLTSETYHQLFENQSHDFQGAVDRAFQIVSKDKDVVIVGGVGSVCNTGTALSMSAAEITSRLQAKALLMGKYNDERSVESILAAKAALGDTMLGTIINRVPRNQLAHVKEKIAPFLEKRSIPVFGIIPRDPVLHSMSVRELAEAIGARIICCEEAADNLVEHLSVGAMNVDSALRYFRHVPNKAVITGGDRADIQLAALETSTRCIVLTGDLHPDARILTRAQELGVPLLLTREDTLATIERIERITGKLRVREDQKIERAMELSREYIDVPRPSAALGLPK